MEYQDKTLVCRDCNGEFTWSAGEQEFYAQKGFNNPPTRCQDCRRKYKDQKRSGQNMTKIICKNCGKEGEVPFTPRNPNDILCADCFAEQRKSGSDEGDRKEESPVAETPAN